ncbi:hypothetical protein L5M36_14515 [Shewanella sp. SM72]|uniref:hypothetical protein n=1 Tax=Shewanella sp. SM72 TaxID=2912805 RepID=UPI0021DB3070|nr:hypothetical protein [Shewanella sp. SM72]MCU8018089.1 hypothetical protein [Shewanella sp. SM72]
MWIRLWRWPSRRQRPSGLTYEVPTAHGIRTIKNRLLSQKIHFSTNKEGDINFSLPGNNMQVSVVMNLNSASLLESSIEMWPTKKGPGIYDYHAEKAKVKKIMAKFAQRAKSVKLDLCTR